jgi:hypothetical protein
MMRENRAGEINSTASIGGKFTAQKKGEPA